MINALTGGGVRGSQGAITTCVLDLMFRDSHPHFRCEKWKLLKAALS